MVMNVLDHSNQQLNQDTPIGFDDGTKLYQFFTQGKESNQANTLSLIKYFKLRFIKK